MIYYGLHSRAAAESRLRTATEAAAVTVVDVISPEAGCTRRRTDSARKHRSVHRLADFRAHQRLPDALVCRHRGARQEGSAARRDRNAGTGSAAAAGAGRTGDGRARCTRWRKSPRPAARICSRPIRCRRRSVTTPFTTRRHRRRPSSRIAPTWRGSNSCSRSARLRAPFDGVITARNTDVGALVDAGATAPARGCSGSARSRSCGSMCRSRSRGRALPSNRSARSTLTLDEFPGRPFAGTVVRNAGAIDIAVAHTARGGGRRQPGGVLLPGCLRAGPLSAAGRGPVGDDSAPTRCCFAPRGCASACVRGSHVDLRANHHRPRLRQHAGSGVRPPGDGCGRSSIRPIHRAMGRSVDVRPPSTGAAR